MAEQVNLTTVVNPAIAIANTVARVLSHPCALDDTLAARLRTIQALQAYWVATATQYNDDEEAGYNGWPTPIVGWKEADDEGRRYLWHTTGTGRLTIFVANDGVELRFEARGGVSVAGVSLVEDAEAPERVSLVLTEDSALIEGREDRLDLLRQVDEALGGMISRLLAAACEESATLAALNLLVEKEAAIRDGSLSREEAFPAPAVDDGGCELGWEAYLV